MEIFGARSSCSTASGSEMFNMVRQEALHLAAVDFRDQKGIRTKKTDSGYIYKIRENIRNAAYITDTTATIR